MKELSRWSKVPASIFRAVFRWAVCAQATVRGTGDLQGLHSKDELPAAWLDLGGVTQQDCRESLREEELSPSVSQRFWTTPVYIASGNTTEHQLIRGTQSCDVKIKLGAFLSDLGCFGNLRRVSGHMPEVLPTWMSSRYGTLCHVPTFILRSDWHINSRYRLTICPFSWWCSTSKKVVSRRGCATPSWSGILIAILA